MSKKALAQSITAKLTRLSQKSGIGFANLRTQFLIERLIETVSASKDISKNLIYKGGYVSLRIYKSPRYTTDIDALSKVPLNKIFEKVKTVVEKERNWDAVWFRFEELIDLKTQGEYPGIRLVFRSGIGDVPQNISKAQTINLDLSYGDAVFPDAIEKKTPWLIGEGSITWKVYPVESIVSEKLHSLISKGSMNSRAKDIYDINFLLDRCKGDLLFQAIAKTFEAIGDPLPKDVVAELKSLDVTRLKKGWASAIRSVDEISFDDVMEELCKKLQKLLKKI